VLRRGASEFDRMENARQVMAVAIETRQVQPGGLRTENRLRDRRVPVPQCRDMPPVTVVLALGQLDEFQERVRDPAASGQDDAQAGARQRIENSRDTPEAVGVGDARPSELVHDPRFGFGHLARGLWKKGSATLLTRSSARNDSVLAKVLILG